MLARQGCAATLTPLFHCSRTFTFVCVVLRRALALREDPMTSAGRAQIWLCALYDSLYDAHRHTQRTRSTYRALARRNPPRDSESDFRSLGIKRRASNGGAHACSTDEGPEAASANAKRQVPPRVSDGIILFHCIGVFLALYAAQEHESAIHVDSSAIGA